jgi:hypothetical protein
MALTPARLDHLERLLRESKRKSNRLYVQYMDEVHTTEILEAEMKEEVSV